MHLMNYYLDLRAGFSLERENRAFRVTLDELAAILYCTTRNVKLLLRKMAEQEWIVWVPGRGRGNASKLTFLISPEGIISREAMLLAQKGDFQGAVTLIHQLKDGEGLEESFFKWLSGYFGHKTMIKEERCTDTLRFPLFKNIHTLDPAHSFYAFDRDMMNQIFDTLVRFDSQTGTIEPVLAHFWEVNEDYTLWTFYLRKGVLFHHGRELTAHDVRFTLMRLRDPNVNSGNAWLVEDIEEITVSNRVMLQIRLKRPNAIFLRLLTFCIASIVPEDIYRENREMFSRIPIGTGPFRVERNDGYICRLKAFEDYYGFRPHLDQVEIWFLPAELKGTNQYFDWGQIISDHSGKIRSAVPSSKQQEWLQIEKVVSGSSLLTFNLKKQGPQQHRNFRRAIDLVFGREQLIRERGGNRISPSSGFQPEQMKIDLIAPLDLEQAKGLLKEMEYDGESLLLYICEHHLEDSKWLQKQCALVGIPIEIVIVAEIDMMRVGKILEADMILYGVCIENNQDLHIIQLLKQMNSYIRAHLSSELLSLTDDKISGILADASEQGRSQKVADLLSILSHENAFLFLIHRSFQTAYHISVKGVTMNDRGWIDFREIWFSPVMKTVL